MKSFVGGVPAIGGEAEAAIFSGYGEIVLALAIGRHRIGGGQLNAWRRSIRTSMLDGNREAALSLPNTHSHVFP